MVMGNYCTWPLLHPLAQPGTLEKQVDSWRNNLAIKTVAQHRQAQAGFPARVTCVPLKTITRGSQ